MNDIEFVSKTIQFVDAKFVLDDLSKGYDCINTLILFYESCDIPFPQEFEGINRSNYADFWLNHPREARAKLRRLLFSLGQRIEPEYALPGDLMIFEGQQMTFPGLYLGNAEVLMVFDRGIKVVPLKFFHHVLIEVRRLLKTPCMENGIE